MSGSPPQSCDTWWFLTTFDYIHDNIYHSFQVGACYRGVELKFIVQDMREEVELKMNAALKDISNTQGAPILKPKIMCCFICVSALGGWV